VFIYKEKQKCFKRSFQHFPFREAYTKNATLISAAFFIFQRFKSTLLSIQSRSQNRILSVELATSVDRAISLAELGASDPNEY
jgi:hypothetical protein